MFGRDPKVGIGLPMFEKFGMGLWGFYELGLVWYVIVSFDFVSGSVLISMSVVLISLWGNVGYLSLA